MYIKSCHIENFGKLQDVHFDFSQQLNMIKEENGWGKSTLMSFIRVMFYGFANEGKRSDLEKERKRFFPWQGGVYGGQLVFSKKGKNYEIVRTFGKKEKDDTFELYDADTHLPSEDFSTKIGEELFGLDASSFARSVYVAQRDCRTVSTDGIHAKLGNLTEDTEDISRFEIVQKQMADLLNKLSPRRKTGEIKKRKVQLEGLEAEILLDHQNAQKIEALQQELEENLREKETVKQQLIEAQKVLGQSADQKLLEAQRENYAALCEQVKRNQDVMEKEKIFFPKGLLTETKWQEYKAQVHALEEEQKQLHQSALTPEEQRNWEVLKERFIEKPPQTVEIERQIADWQERSQQQQKVHQNENLCLVLQQDIEKYEQEIHEADDQPANEAAGWNVCLGIGIALIAVGVICLFFHIVLALPFFVIGAGMFGKGWGEHQLKKKREEQVEFAQETQAQAQEQSAEEKKEQIRKLQEENEKLQKEIETKDLLMQQFLERCHIEYRTQDILPQLFQLKTDSAQYRNLEKKVQSYEWTKKKCLGFLEQLSELLREQEMEPPTYEDEADDCFTWQLQEWSEHRVAYRMAQQNLQIAKAKAEEFAKSHDLEADEVQTQTVDSVELQQRCTELTKQVEALGEKRLQLSQKLQLYTQKAEELRQKEQEAQTVREEIETLEKKYATLQLTQQYLTQACESLTAKYMEPVMKGFRKYFQLLTQKAAVDWQLDANSVLRHKEAGQHRETGWLSEGWQDLTGICLRMAFADAMYTEEKPMLLLDDPFVNLDEEKVQGGLQFLQEASKEYQILYFTCHESRQF